MGEKITLTLDVRTAHGKKVSALRRENLVPGVVYGPGIDPISVQAVQQVIDKIAATAGKHAPVHLLIANKKHIAMIKDIDVDPVKHRIRHISFHAVRQNEPVEAEVPIRIIGEGESEAEKVGLIILQNIDTLEVKALPMNLPEALEIDTRHLKEAGEKLTVADITLPKDVELVEHETGHVEEDEEAHSVTDQLVVSVWEPSALQAQNEASGGDAEDESEVESENGAEIPVDNEAAADPASEK